MNLRANPFSYTCGNCGESQSKHCGECDGCPDEHSGNCSQSY